MSKLPSVVLIVLIVMPVLKVEGTPVLRQVLESKHRITVLEGSTSSSKTFSLAQAHIIWSFQEVGKTYSVVRDTLPALKRSALKDFRQALSLMYVGEAEAYAYFKENKTELSFTNLQTGTRIEFLAFDNEQKARGPRRDRLWCNEGNELPRETYRQLVRRTHGQIFIDYNPSMLSSYIYDEVLPREDCLHLHSTYRDNPFLSAETVREIEQDVPVYEEASGHVIKDWNLTYTGSGALISGDPYQWAVYGLGRRGAPSEAIYPLVYLSKAWPVGAENRPYGSVLGLDFGFNHPMVLARVAMRDIAPNSTGSGGPELHIDELLHERFLTTADLIERLPGLGVTKLDHIYADGSRPEAIKEMRDAGYNAQAARKGPGSVRQGIDLLKRYRLCFTRRSKRSKVQFQDYQWKKRPDGTITDEPVKLNDDAPDAVRYAVFSHWGQAQNYDYEPVYI